MMKFIYDSYYENQEIIDLINMSNPSSNSKLSFLNIKDTHGWTYFTAKLNEHEFSINYSSLMTETSYLFEFFTEIMNLKEETVLFLDNEGTLPVLYVSPVNNDNVRFIFAQDYDLYDKEPEDGRDEFDLTDYKIECDIIIDKHSLLNEFYNALYPFIKKCNIEKPYEPFNIKRCEECLEEIKKYLKTRFE